MDETQRAELGARLDAARQLLGLSTRAAAKKAKVSDTRWRQVVAGFEERGGHRIPTNPRADTVAAMARAVELDPAEVLAAAGLAAPTVSQPSSGMAALRLATNAELAREVADRLQFSDLSALSADEVWDIARRHQGDAQ